MGLELTALFHFFMVPISAITSIYALIFLVSRTRLSRIVGMISLACVCATLLIPMALNGRLPGSRKFFFFCLGITAGIVAIVFNRAKPLIPGHCTKCGYDLTGNVSGICSECGEATAVAAVRS